MTTYSLDRQDQEPLTWRDDKRYMWLSSVMMPLLALSGIALYLVWEQTWLLAIPLVYGYLVMPILDAMVGEDESNPPEALVPQIDDDRYYRILTMVTVPMHYIVLALFAWFVAVHEFNPLVVAILAITAGGYSGLAINTAHELGHKNTPIERVFAKLALAVPAYGHFCVEHNRGHHKHVSTPEDPASSRMGESLWRFAPREIGGTFVRGIALEKERLARDGKGFWTTENEILQSYAISAVFQGSILILGGLKLLPFLLLHNVWAWFQLTCANYVEHYGLLRAKLDNGRYEPTQPHHSWNANWKLSNIVLFHLQRHSDHHANPTRRYQSLRHFEDIPQLPNGYYGMYLLAYFPPLWYRVMDKRLLSLPHIRGDLNKVNIDPHQRPRIELAYGD